MPALLALAAVALSAAAGPSAASAGGAAAPRRASAGSRSATGGPAGVGPAGGQRMVLRSADIPWHLAAASRSLLCDPARVAETGPDITLALFPDVTVEVTGGQVRPGPAGAVDWSAQVKGDTDGAADFHFDALCTGPGGAADADAVPVRVVAQISTGGHTYTLATTTPGTAHVAELNPAVSEGAGGEPDDPVPPKGDPAPPSTAPAVAPAPAGTPQADDTPADTRDGASSDCQGAKDVNSIDLAVFYTKEAADTAGGDDQAKAQAQLAVDLVNRGFTNSKLPVRARLVHAGPAADEPGLPTEEDGLGKYWQWASDNGLWKKYAADDIAVFQSVGSGVGYVVQDPKPSDGESMFFKMNISYISNLTFGHELGHNLGLKHDWVTDPAPGNYPYAHGWFPPSKKWRTIMAYPQGCDYCGRINYYSNAEATYEGEPMGAPDSAPEPADAVRMIRKNAPVMAAMQPEKTPAVYCRLTVKPTPNTGGSTTVDIPGPYTRGTLVHATATAKPNYRLIGWSLNGSPLDSAGTDASVSVPVDVDSTLEARYAQLDCALTLRAEPSEGGTVTADRPAPYECGSTVTLTATAASGWQFADWNSEDGPQTRRDAPAPVRQFTLDQDTVVTATFAQAAVVPPAPPAPPTPPTPNPDPSGLNPPLPPKPVPPSPKPELATTGTSVPLVETSLLAGLAVTAGGVLLARLRRKDRGDAPTAREDG
ncbi:hypothetical protein GCM10009760_32020 [Kitasatospora kazusensis]|uniref:Bacterial repeat domain-containing protein n=1 Tax=Kitasatospora kazusensis TaxID=407974 RepID=A0ABP5LE70_9ACTN